METTFVGGATRLWLYAGDPDSTVHNSSGSYASQGEIFLNTTNQVLFFCYQGGMSQLWLQICYLSQTQDLISAIPQANWTQSNVSASDYIKNKPTIPAAQVQSDWTQSNSSAVDYIKNKPASPSARSQSSASRSLNSVFQVSASRDCLANYSVDIATSLTLITGQSGTVFLEIASDSGFTSNVQELARFVNGNTGTLTIGLSLSQNVTGTLSGYIPTGYYARLRTANNTGTPTFTYRSGQEVLL